MLDAGGWLAGSRIRCGFRQPRIHPPPPCRRHPASRCVSAFSERHRIRFVRAGAGRWLHLMRIFSAVCPRMDAEGAAPFGSIIPPCRCSMRADGSPDRASRVDSANLASTLRRRAVATLPDGVYPRFQQAPYPPCAHWSRTMAPPDARLFPRSAVRMDTEGAAPCGSITPLRRCSMRADGSPDRASGVDSGNPASTLRRRAVATLPHGVYPRFPEGTASALSAREPDDGST